MKTSDRETAARLAQELNKFIGSNPTKLKIVNAYLVDVSAGFYLKANDSIIG
jgi:hypothetical protein